jgi:CRP-like cAMP-binding protein
MSSLDVRPDRGGLRRTVTSRHRRISSKAVDPAGVLLRTPIFGDLSPEDVESLLPELRDRTFRRGQPVWIEGDPAESLWVLAEGQLKSHRVSRDGAEVILEFHSSIDVLGEVGLFHPSGRRQVSVSAMQPSRCLTVARAPLVAFMAGHPVVMQRMLERLSTTAVRAAYSFSGVAFDDIRRRVAGALLALGEEFGEPTAGGVRIRLRLSQGSLAALVAASRENVNRALSSLIASGAVSQREGHFVVHDRAALQRASATGATGGHL